MSSHLKYTVYYIRSFCEKYTALLLKEYRLYYIVCQFFYICSIKMRSINMRADFEGRVFWKKDRILCVRSL